MTSDQLIEQTYGCNCIPELNEKLREHNSRIDLAILLPEPGRPKLRSRVLIKVEKLDLKKRREFGLLMASYCPFCGVKQE
ncbi:MAG: hypothetical protein Q7W55_10375 [Pseudohongiella sp.]|nr:hypothetical protein [Pseudohongiella sp.]